MNMTNLKLEKLEEYVWRWNNHYKMLETLKQTNIDPQQLTLWKNQIDECFRNKIKAKL